MFDIASEELAKAVRQIERRAERQLYEEKLTRSYVPTKVIRDLDTTQNQLIYGRRGVGKTHTLKYYLSQVVTHNGNLCHYIDCTTFGSGIAQMGSPLNVAIRFFSEVIRTLSDDLLEDAVRLETPFGLQLERVQDLLVKLTELSEPGDPSVFRYKELVTTVEQLLIHLSSERLVLIIDEWAQIPLAAQPYFAEFLKRSLLQSPKITLKISIVDYTHKLSVIEGGQQIGLEKSGDVFSDIRMDQFFVWDEDHDFVEGFFAEVLFNHLSLGLFEELPACADADKRSVVVSDLFTGRKAFAELCRASEGNTRDFLVIFSRALGEFARQQQRERIGLPDIQTAASHWYRQDKQTLIATERHLEGFVASLLNDVIKNRRARTFMVPLEDMSHPVLQRLFGARILHPLKATWSNPSKPGERYQLVTIDYGTYVTLIGTKAAPFEPVFWPLNEAPPSDIDDLVPFDDRRSIRQIFVGREILDRHLPQQDLGALIL